MRGYSGTDSSIFGYNRKSLFWAEKAIDLIGLLRDQSDFSSVDWDISERDINKIS